MLFIALNKMALSNRLNLRLRPLSYEVDEFIESKQQVRKSDYVQTCAFKKFFTLKSDT